MMYHCGTGKRKEIQNGKNAGRTVLRGTQETRSQKKTPGEDTEETDSNDQTFNLRWTGNCNDYLRNNYRHKDNHQRK